MKIVFKNLRMTKKYTDRLLTYTNNAGYLVNSGGNIAESSGSNYRNYEVNGFEGIRIEISKQGSLPYYRFADSNNSRIGAVGNYQDKTTITLAIPEGAVYFQIDTKYMGGAEAEFDVYGLRNAPTNP